MKGRWLRYEPFSRGCGPRTRMSFRTGMSIVVGANVSVWAAWQLYRQDDSDEGIMGRHFVFSWANLVERPWVMVTSCVSHREVSHLLMDLAGMSLFSWPVWQAVGPVGFCGVYLLGNVMADLVQVGLEKQRFGSSIPAPISAREAKKLLQQHEEQQGQTPAQALQSVRHYIADHYGQRSLGASASVMALAGVAMVLVPRDRWTLWRVSLPVGLIAGFVAMNDLLGSLDRKNAYRSSNIGHLGGLSAGLVFAFGKRQQVLRQSRFDGRDFY